MRRINLRMEITCILKSCDKQPNPSAITRSVLNSKAEEGCGNNYHLPPSCTFFAQKSIGSLVEVWQKSSGLRTQQILLVSASVHQKSSQSPVEVQWKSNGGLSLDFAWTTSGIQSCPTDSDGLPMDCPLSPWELAGSDESPTESVGQAVGV